MAGMHRSFSFAFKGGKSKSKKYKKRIEELREYKSDALLIVDGNDIDEFVQFEISEFFFSHFFLFFKV